MSETLHSWKSLGLHGFVSELYTCTFCQFELRSAPYSFVQLRSDVFHHTLIDDVVAPGQTPFLSDNSPVMSMFWARHILVYVVG